METTKNIKIAIDGPVASGKSTGAYLLSQKLDILYVYTGAMYRAAAWMGLENDIDLQNERELIELLEKKQLELTRPSEQDRVCNVLVDGEDITDQLFSSKVDWGSSVVATHGKVRKYLVDLQRKMAEGRSVVMEGRDIGTVVLPAADLKIYLTADQEVRARRKWQMLTERGEDKTYEEVLADVKKRDKQDKGRKINPLRKAEDAWVLDTTGLSVAEEIEKVIDKLEQIGLVKTNGN
jgi:cytidylate kinase